MRERVIQSDSEIFRPYRSKVLKRSQNASCTQGFIRLHGWFVQGSSVHTAHGPELNLPDLNSRCELLTSRPTIHQESCTEHAGKWSVLLLFGELLEEEGGERGGEERRR